MRLEQADLVAVFGGTGTGKSYVVRALTRHDLRLVVWDYMAEYPGQPCDSLARLAAMLKRPRFRIAFRPSMRDLAGQFDTFCRCVYAAGRCRIVVEELNAVTQPSCSPPAWREITSRGRHRGLHVIGVSQRPASVDKDFIGNATQIIAGRLTYIRDCRALEPQLGGVALTLPELENRVFVRWQAGKSNVTRLTL